MINNTERINCSIFENFYNRQMRAIHLLAIEKHCDWEVINMLLWNVGEISKLKEVSVEIFEEVLSMY